MKIINVIYNIIATVIVLVFVFTVGLKITDTKVFAVATPSMEDELYEGDMVFVRETDTFLEGDIITARLSNGGQFTHRVYSVDEENRLVYTMGDNNPQPDPQPTSFDDVVGKVVFSVPQLGNLSLKFNATNIILLLAGILVALTVIRFVVFRIKSKEEEAV